MNPSHVRTRILQDHTALRLHLRKLEDAVDAMLADTAKASVVSELAGHLLQDLTRHTELEDEILAPALLEADAWGRVRADQLLLHHRQQRTQIRELHDLYNDPSDPMQVAQATYALVRDLHADMDHEEREILSADLLRDDVVSVGSECG